MKIAATYLPYLNGSRFHNGVRFTLVPEKGDYRYQSRAALLQEMLRGKNVVHVGFVDHDIASIDAKRKKGKWLHAQLLQATNRCVGIDINAEAIAYVRDRLNVPDVHCADVTSPAIAAVLAGTEWDCIFLGEVIEHIPNPLGFLQAMLHNFSACGIKFQSVMLSTPNGLHNERLQHMRLTERINSDHRYVFTPYTLSKIMTEAGLHVESIKFCRNGSVKKRSVLNNAYFTLFPMLRSCLLATGKAAR